MTDGASFSGLASFSIARRCVAALRAAGILAVSYHHCGVSTIEAGNGAVYCIRIASSEVVIDPLVPGPIADIVRSVWTEEERSAAEDRASLAMLARLE